MSDGSVLDYENNLSCVFKIHPQISVRHMLKIEFLMFDVGEGDYVCTLVLETVCCAVCFVVCGVCFLFCVLCCVCVVC